MSTVLHEPLDIRVVRKIYPASGVRDAQPVLKDIAIKIEPRSFVVLTGPSGCGKSTLLNIIAGLDSQYEGEIKLGGPETRVRLHLPVAAPAALAHGTAEHRTRAAGW